MPEERKNEYNSYHTFVIQVPQRDKLKKYLFQHGIETAIHYPTPIHLQPAAKFLQYQKGDFKVTERQSKEILTLPIHQYMTKQSIVKISNLINSFYFRKKKQKNKTY